MQNHSGCRISPRIFGYESLPTAIPQGIFPDSLMVDDAHTHTYIYILYCRISNCSLAGSRNSICIRAELQLLCAPDLPEPSQSTRTLTVYRCEIDIKQVLFRPFCFVATGVIPSRILVYTRPMYWRIVSTKCINNPGV